MAEETLPPQNPTSSSHIATGSGLAKGIAAGLSGEQLSTQGLLEAVGGVRGIFEALLPGLLYLVMFILTQDARMSVIVPSTLAILAFIGRLIQKQTLVTALSGVFGVGICVVTTLVTGKGEDYFLPGFWINGAWSVVIIISLIVGWPVLGFLVGALRGEMTAWRSVPQLRKAAMVASVLWLVMFVARLGVQLPLYFVENVTALGIARLVMGTPLFALVVLGTWLLFRNIPHQQQQDNE